MPTQQADPPIELADSREADRDPDLVSAPEGTGTPQAPDALDDPAGQAVTAAGPGVDTAGADDRPAGYRDVFGVREFRAVFAADLFSLIGDQIAAVAVAVLLYQDSGSPLLAAVGYATAYVPWLLGGPLLAAWAERFPGRSVMVACDLSRAGLIGIAALPGMPSFGVAALVFLAAMMAPPFDAARSALLAQILTGNRYPVGMSLRQAVHQIAQLCGFAIGGALVLAVSAPGVLAIDCLTFLASAALLRSGLVRRPAPNPIEDDENPPPPTVAPVPEAGEPNADGETSPYRPRRAPAVPGPRPAAADPTATDDHANETAAAPTDAAPARDRARPAQDRPRKGVTSRVPEPRGRGDDERPNGSRHPGDEPGPTTTRTTTTTTTPATTPATRRRSRSGRARSVLAGGLRRRTRQVTGTGGQGEGGLASSTSTSIWRDMVAGFGVVRGDAQIWFPLMLGIVGAAYAIVPEAIATAYAAELGHDSSAVGLIMAAAAAGSVVGGLAIGRFAAPGTAARIMYPLALIGTVPLLVIALRPNLVVSLALFVLCGLGQAFQVVANTQFASHVPAEVRTRAFGIAIAGLYGGQSLAILLAGAAAQWLAPSTVIAGSGLAGAAGLLLLPYLRPIALRARGRHSGE
ncbi:MFS transporter [Kineosporia sp. J2-2]|uniref:MFS transporter n=1 Tax=Kineosporia corallincola TaxID=2835133 RepID=A0ABS5TPL0_9ACTN|nr:MFS transporter [Kineosporia corallincola]MBT0773031.1 MFS transporter [Kineosporia corallincola]